ncbi:hypothetical protein GCM10022254_72720 [Actinomadura meridiana]|uniref:Uncharacterized protein n=1 Tax=Actinomadura meridiana TaxID=559626 RepID=A0ABP8CQC3_9ACTN
MVVLTPSALLRTSGADHPHSQPDPRVVWFPAHLILARPETPDRDPSPARKAVSILWSPAGRTRFNPDNRMQDTRPVPQIERRHP